MKLTRPIRLLAGFFIVVLVASSCNEEKPRVINSGNQNTPDRVGPSVAMTVPADAETDVPVNIDIEITFSEEIDTMSISNLSVIVGDSVPGSLKYDDKVLSFRPASNLVKRTLYEVKVSKEIEDLAGNSMKESYDWSFRTGDRIILDSADSLAGFYEGTYTITTDYGSNLAKEYSQPITWEFTDTSYAMQIDTSTPYDPNFAICQVDGRYVLNEGIQLIEVHSIPDPFTACRDKYNPNGLFILTKSNNADTLTLRQNNPQTAVFKQILLIRD